MTAGYASRSATSRADASDVLRPALLAALIVLLVSLSGCAFPFDLQPPPRAPRPATPARPKTRRPEAVLAPCTTAWIGPAAGGLWRDARNWSGGRLPALADVACVPAGATVTVSHVGVHVGALIDGGGVVVRDGGSLELAGGSFASELGVLRIQRGGRVYGRARLLARDVLLLGGVLAPGEGRLVSPGPPAVWCGPYTPAGLHECAPPPRPADVGAVRATWRRFVALVQSGRDPRGIAAMLTPGACVPSGRRPPRAPAARRATCLRAARAMPADPAVAAYAPELTNLMVEGARAYADARAAGNVRFVRRRGHWRIFMFGSYGDPRVP
jgi:hypothetical protein